MLNLVSNEPVEKSYGFTGVNQKRYHFALSRPNGPCDDSVQFLTFTRVAGPYCRLSIHSSENHLHMMVRERASQFSEEDVCALLDAIFSHYKKSECIFWNTGTLMSHLDSGQHLPFLERDDMGFVCYRQSFYQWPNYFTQTSRDLLSQRFVTTGTIQHPKREPSPRGLVYQRFQHALGMMLELKVADPVADLPIFHRWMNDPRIAPVWELAHDRETLSAYLQKQLVDPHLYPLIGYFDGKPFGYFEVYWAQEDRLGAYYEARPYDRGMHVLVGEPQFLGKPFTMAWLKALTHYLFLDDTRTQFVMGEPNASNNRILRYARWLPYRQLKIFDFPHKRAALMQCSRQDFFNEAVLS